MMFNYPYMNFPYYRRYPNYYNKSNSSYYRKNCNSYNEEKKENSCQINDKCNNINISQKKENSEDETSEFIEIFGIKLFFDDILLICLIFFLYSEGIKDQYLFISLILLLLS